MTAPRLEIDLDKIYHNARTLVERLAERGISVTGVTKATLGSPEIARTLLRAGVSAIGDSRIENIATLRRAGVPTSMTLIRSPMITQADRVVTHADVSFNTELDVISALSSSAVAAGRTHGIVLMVELGDLREGIMPGDLVDVVRETLRFPNISFKGIGTNLACRSGVSPDAKNMTELSALAGLIEATFGVSIDIVSGGNSANLEWALSGADSGRINDLRLGEGSMIFCCVTSCRVFRLEIHSCRSIRLRSNQVATSMASHSRPANTSLPKVSPIKPMTVSPSADIDCTRNEMPVAPT